LAQWLGALHLILFSMLYCRTEGAGVMENGEIKQIKALLANDLYDSKDWREGDFIDRVEWLISTVKSQAEEIELWLGQIERLREENERQRQQIMLLNSMIQTEHKIIRSAPKEEE
jgi:hypothetical protein